MQRTKTNPEIRPHARKPVVVSLKAPDPSTPAALPDSARTWSDQMRQIEQLEDPERWDGMS